MLEPRSSRGGLRVVHGAVMVAAAGVAVVLAWIVLSAIVGFVLKLVEIAVVVAVLAAVIGFIFRHARKH